MPRFYQLFWTSLQGAFQPEQDAALAPALGFKFLDLRFTTGVVAFGLLFGAYPRINCSALATETGLSCGRGVVMAVSYGIQCYVGEHFGNRFHTLFGREKVFGLFQS